jgi:serine/threonine-protein kinase
MGAVYLAERADGQFDRRVAIKFARQTIADSEVVRRFREERQILARLQHPNIAGLLDGGLTAEGQPYLVMEYIEGLPVTDHCAGNNLSLRDRLKLFLKICRGLGYAHRNLIIHRDIKPSNILVTPDNEPKLLDFGLAKLEDADENTRTVFRALTPAYASPEQLAGSTVNTASDIYSLGIVLYEMLTGARPFETDGKSLEEVLRTVTQTEPPPPSTRVSDKRMNLKGDLDNIVSYALRKEPDRRYHSVEEFSRDIENYLDGLPVIARPNTLGYRAGKFIRRNAIAVGAAAAMGLTLIGGTGLALRQAGIAQAAEKKAESEAVKAQKVTAFMEKVLNYANPSWYAEGNKLRGEAKLIEVVDDLSSKISTEFADDPEIQAELHHKFAEIYLAKSNTAKSIIHAEKALELRRRVFGEKHPDVAKDIYYLSATRFTSGNLLEALRLGEEAIAMFHEVAPDNANLPYLLEDNVDIRLNNYPLTDKPESYLKEALELFRRRDGESHPNTARLYMKLSWLYAKKGDIAESDRYFGEGEKRYSEFTDEGQKTFFVLQRAAIARAKGDNVAFESLLQTRLTETTKKGEAESHPARQIQNTLANFYWETDNFEKHAEVTRVLLSIESRKPILDEDFIGQQKAGLSYCLLRLGKEAEARLLFEEAYRQFKKSPDENKWLFESIIGSCLFYLGRYAEAEPHLRHALDEYNANIPPGKNHKMLSELLKRTETALGKKKAGI